jgi:HTH-type transcriptional regulator, competence development regulator
LNGEQAVYSSQIEFQQQIEKIPLDNVYYILHITNMNFGEYVRETRERLKEADKRFSVRQVAMRIGIEPAYLSKIERGDFSPPSEVAICRLAKELNLDADVLLAMGGKVSKDLQEIILKRPRLFADLIRELKGAPNKALLRIVREVRDGDW